MPPQTRLRSQKESSAKKPKLQEQSSTKVQKSQGQSASTSTQLGTRFLVSRLPLFITDGQLIAVFGQYGEIVSIDFIHRTDRDYHLCCVVRIVLHDDAAGVRMVQNVHAFTNVKATAELYLGNDRHHALEKGIYELEIHNVKVIGSRNTNGQMIYNFLENLFHGYSYSGMELRKSSLYKYTGEVVIFFVTENGREQARESIQSQFPGWVVQQ